MIDKVTVENIGFAESGKPAYQEGFGQQLRSFSTLLDFKRKKDEDDKTPLAEVVKEFSLISDAKVNGNLDSNGAAMAANKAMVKFVSKHPELAQEAMAMRNAAFGESGAIGGIRTSQDDIEEAQRKARVEQYTAAFSAMTPSEQKRVGNQDSPEVTKKILSLTSAIANANANEIETKKLQAESNLSTVERSSREEILLNEGIDSYVQMYTSEINSIVNTITQNSNPSDFANKPEGDILALAGEGLRDSAIRAKQDLISRYPTMYRSGALAPLIEQIDSMSSKAIDLVTKRSEDTITAYENSVKLYTAVNKNRLWSDPRIAKVLATFQSVAGVDLTGTELGRILNISMPDFTKGVEDFYKNIPLSTTLDISEGAAKDIAKVVNNPENLKNYPNQVDALTATLIQSLNNPDVNTKVYDETLSLLSANPEVALRVLSPKHSDLSETAREKLTLYYKALGESLGNSLYTELSTKIEEPLPDNNMADKVVNFLAPFGFANLPADPSVLPKSVKAVQVLDIRVTDSTFKFSPKKGFEKYPEVVRVAERLNKSYSKRLEFFSRTYTHLEQASGKSIGYREGFDSILSGESSFSFLHEPKKGV